MRLRTTRKGGHIDCCTGAGVLARPVALKTIGQRSDMSRLRIGYGAAASSLAVLLAGCVHGNPTTRVAVDRGYESVYLALLKDARRCYPATAGTAQREVNGTLDGPGRAGKVTFSFRSPTAQETFMNVDIRGTESTRSQVDIQVAPGWEAHAQAVRGWLEGTSSACV
jgi:hypothetical protein